MKQNPQDLKLPYSKSRIKYLKVQFMSIKLFPVLNHTILFYMYPNCNRLHVSSPVKNYKKGENQTV